VRRCAYKHFSLILCCEGFINPVSLMQRDEAQRIEVQYRVSISGRSVSHLQSPFSSPCRTCSRRATRGRALKPPCSVEPPCPVGPSKFGRVYADVLFVKLGGATGPYLPLVHLYILSETALADFLRASEHVLWSFFLPPYGF